MVQRLEDWGFLLKSPSGEYKLDDRGKIITLTAEEADPSLTNGFFTVWLKEKRELIEQNPEQYQDKKERLYQLLARIVKSMSDKEVQERAEQRFHKISQQTDSASHIKQDLTKDIVQVNEH